MPHAPPAPGTVTTAPLRIGPRLVGLGQPVFIVAEIGVNHNGDPALARTLVAAAQAAGADAVKFQTFSADRLATAAAPKAAYQTERVGSGSQRDMLRALELSPEALGDLRDEAKLRGLTFLSTPFDVASVDQLEALGVPAYKIGSGDLTNLPLLEHTARKGKPMIVSTGMANLDEVKAAHELLQRLGAAHMFLHCTSRYPAPLDDLNLRALPLLRAQLGVEVGYSDHSLSPAVAVAAVALGASLLETHLTMDRNLPGPDHQASLEPTAFAAYARAVRDAERALGGPHKVPSRGELEVARVARRSIVARVNLERGTRLTADHLDVKRPGTGISPMRWHEVVGRRLARNVDADRPISWEDLERAS